MRLQTTIPLVLITWLWGPSWQFTLLSLTGAPNVKYIGLNGSHVAMTYVDDDRNDTNQLADTASDEGCRLWFVATAVYSIYTSV